MSDSEQRLDPQRCWIDFEYTMGHLRVTVEEETVIDRAFDDYDWVRLANLQDLLTDGCSDKINHIVIEIWSVSGGRWNIDWKFWVHDRYGNEYWTNGDRASSDTAAQYKWDHHICWSSTKNPLVIDLSRGTG
jgi:hypothetical protein